ncbi:MAG: hypothetical protein LBL75_03485 [Rickettsiales bacterium]|nr:hypothetical protein [Rickettsiales bacterium]
MQPFNDYNKRTARMVMNWILFQNGLTPIIFHYKKDRTKYLNAIRNYDKKNVYEKFMLSIMLRTQQEILNTLGYSI